MTKIKCLGCYEFLELDLPHQYHRTCSKKLFGTEIPPEINFDLKDLPSLALKVLTKHLGLTGVQTKLSTRMDKKTEDPTHRLMIVDLDGNFILKPPTKEYPNISLLESVTMHMASLCGLKVSKHGLIKLKSGEISYITKRFDRPKKGKKLAVEDFCQLSELLTENKYDSSMEKAGKIISKYSTNSGLDQNYFFDLTLFCFLTGNSDMHLKNFSLIKQDSGEITLTPFYDLLSTQLILKEDKEEMALPINGKKNKLKKADFKALGKNLELSELVMERSIKRLLKRLPLMQEMIKKSFLTKTLQDEYLQLIERKAKIFI